MILGIVLECMTSTLQATTTSVISHNTGIYISIYISSFAFCTLHLLPFTFSGGGARESQAMPLRFRSRTVSLEEEKSWNHT